MMSFKFVTLLVEKAARDLDDDLYNHLPDIAAQDVAELTGRGYSYGDSWKRRGGIGAFFVLARKWDRIENILKSGTTSVPAWDIFKHVENDPSEAGILDDIRDLRRYLMLVEAEMVSKGIAPLTHEYHSDDTGQDQPFGYDPEEDNL